MNAISTHRLTKYYGSTRGIRELELTVPQGDFFGFIGPNGAGKSTTIRTLLGLLSPTSGQARLFGETVSRATLPSLLRRVGYLPAEVSLYRGMRVEQLLAFSASLRGMNCSARAADLCRRLDLDVTRKVDGLSLGNRKKVGLVCALQHAPELYILDEPTSGLDPLIQRELYAILTECNREGATVFLSSHVLSEVQHHCRHAAVIREGQILTTDRVEALQAAGTRRVTLRGVSHLPPLEGVRDLHTTESGLTFLYAGAPGALLRALSPLPLTDLSIAEPDLEEVFLHYYQGGASQ